MGRHLFGTNQVVEIFSVFHRTEVDRVMVRVVRVLERLVDWLLNHELRLLLHRGHFLAELLRTLRILSPELLERVMQNFVSSH